MALSNSALRWYDSKILRLPADKRKEYHAQVDRLVEELCKSIRNKTEIKITKVMKAGSFAKFTILRKTSIDPVDVDVIFYVAGKDASQETLESLAEQIYDLLVEQYPSKSVEDFEIQKRTAKVTFVGSGLEVDIVPIIEDSNRAGYGWQFDLKTGDKVETCPPGQIKFIRTRKDNDADFRTLVRMAKKWRNHTQLENPAVGKLKSFMIELIMARVLDKQGSDGSIEQRFRNFLLYIAESELKEEISFPENSYPLGSFDDPVVILDPVASDNNVCGRLTEAERKGIVEAADAAWETASLAAADNDNDLEVWKELFGPRFKTED